MASAKLTLREGQKLWLRWISARYGKREAKEALRSGFLSWTDNATSEAIADPQHISKQDVFKAYQRYISTIEHEGTNPSMTVAEARRIFGELMKKARERELSPSEKALLSRARQTLRGAAKSVMRNPRQSKFVVGDVVYVDRSQVAPSLAKDLFWRVFVDRAVIRQLSKDKTRAEIEFPFGKKYWFDVEALEFDPGRFSGRNPRKLTRKKARTILHEGKVRGRRLTAKQRRFFGARASGYPRRKAKTNLSSLIRMGKLVELRYHRDQGKSPGYYKHVFKARPTLYYDRERNRIVAG